MVCRIKHQELEVKNMKTNENYKIAAERVKRANKKISDAQI